MNPYSDVPEFVSNDAMAGEVVYKSMELEVCRGVSEMIMVSFSAVAAMTSSLLISPLST